MSFQFFPRMSDADICHLANPDVPISDNERLQAVQEIHELRAELETARSLLRWKEPAQ